MKNNLLPLKKGLIRSTVLFLFILSSSIARSQISTMFVSLPDTAFMSSGDTALVIVENVDNQPYSGYINVYFSTDTITFAPFMVCSIPSVSLNPNDTILTNCWISFDSTYFNSGSNIVVVWSSGNAKFAADTVWDSVYIVSQTAGIHENVLNSSFSIFPSLAKDIITIKLNRSKLPNDLIRKIKITDVFGRTIFVEPFADKEGQKINVEHLPHGLYFLELLYGDRKRAVQKFVKAD